MSRSEEIAELLKFPNKHTQAELGKWAEKIGYSLGKALFALDMIAKGSDFIDTKAMAEQTLDEIEKKVKR